MKKLLFTGLLWAGLFSVPMAQDSTTVLENVSSLQEALAIAKKEHKLVFIDCYFQGCAPCAQMDREVYPNSLVKPALQKDFIPVKVDVRNEKWGDSLCMQYALSGFPSLIVLNEDGLLVARESGYKDAGQFLQFLTESKTKNLKQHYLAGFGAAGTENLPAFYKESYGKSRAPNPAEASKFIHAQKDWLEDKTGFAIISSLTLDKDVEDFLVKNNQAFTNKYGEELVQGKIEKILVNRMASVVKRQKNEPAFLQFLQQYESNFSKSDWKNYLQLLAVGYYAGIEKDTTAYLRFMSTHPVIYRYYFNSFFYRLVQQKTDSKENFILMAKWAEAVVNIETSLQIIQAAADVHKRAGHIEGYRKYINLCLKKIDKYNMDDGKNKAYYEKLLAST